jgi:hypothetical protein
MCFSATASFAVAVALACVGAASMARNPSPRGRMLAAIPLVFAAQQATEGIVWLTVSGSAHVSLQPLAVDAFLAFALIVWPLWFPGALLLPVFVSTTTLASGNVASSVFGDAACNLNVRRA